MGKLQSKGFSNDLAQLQCLLPHTTQRRAHSHVFFLHQVHFSPLISLDVSQDPVKVVFLKFKTLYGSHLFSALELGDMLEFEGVTELDALKGLDGSDLKTECVFEIEGEEVRSDFTYSSVSCQFPYAVEQLQSLQEDQCYSIKKLRVQTPAPDVYVSISNRLSFCMNPILVLDIEPKLIMLGSSSD